MSKSGIMLKCFQTHPGCLGKCDAVEKVTSLGLAEGKMEQRPMKRVPPATLQKLFRKH